MKEMPLTPRDALLYFTTLIIFLKRPPYFSCKLELKIPKSVDFELINNFEDLA